jgi:hypothetical protein
MRPVGERSTDRHPERGAVLVMVAVSMVVLVGFVALAVDLGYLFVTRNQVQNVADGSALAGARTLGHGYQLLSQEEQQTFTCGNDCVEEVRAAARDVAAKNRAAGAVMGLLDEDILIGQWDGDTFEENLYRPDAVLVMARREGDPNGPVSTFFSRVLGIDEVPVNAVAVAAMTGQGTAAEGEVELPIGISSWFFDSAPEEEDRCNDYIKFYPTNDPESCAGWTTWDYNSNDNNIRRILEGVYESPETIANSDYFNFTGGTLSNPTFDALLTLFQHRGFAVDANGEYVLVDGQRVDFEMALTEPPGVVPIMELNNQGQWVQAEYPDGTLRYLHRWDTTVPVYGRGDCSNPNQSIEIVGFTRVELTDVLSAPDKMVRGRVVCDVVSPEPNRGGGGNYGIKGPIPGLVR